MGNLKWHTTDADLEQFARVMSDGFQKAIDVLDGLRTDDLIIAGRRVRLQIAGGALHHLARPLAHAFSHGCQNIQPLDVNSLEIRAWHSAQGWSPPNPPWKQGQQGLSGDIVGLGSGRFSINYHDGSGLLCFHDAETQKAFFWIDDPSKLPFWEIASPFRQIFHWWAQSFHAHLAHGAVVGVGGRGILLAGKGGSGKSATALTCVDARMHYVGDDYVLLTRDPVPVAHSLYQTAKLHRFFLEQALPHWRPHVKTYVGPEQKAVLYLYECMPEVVCSQLQIKALILPRVRGHGEPRLAAATQAAGMLALAPSTLFQLPSPRANGLAFFSTWMRNMPVFTLETGTNSQSIPRILTNFLMQHPIEAKHAHV